MAHAHRKERKKKTDTTEIGDSVVNRMTQQPDYDTAFWDGDTPEDGQGGRELAGGYPPTRIAGRDHRGTECEEDRRFRHSGNGSEHAPQQRRGFLQHHQASLAGGP